jgi:hypothetical protein
MISLLFVRCQKDDSVDKEEPNSFNIDITTGYKSDTIQVGDTIWFESKTNGMLIDINTQDRVYFGEAILTVNLLVRSWNIQNQGTQQEKYNVILKSPTQYITYTTNTTMIGVYYYKNAGYYLMRFGVVFYSPGTYSIDGDYLKFKNYHTNEYVKLGGDGIMKFNDFEGAYKEAYLYPEMKQNNTNLEYDLTEEDKSLFHLVDDANKSKYFFINVIK